MKKKILIVEDEFVVANAIRLIVEQAGYKVIAIAMSAEEAYDVIGGQRPDLVLLDIRLIGEQSGIDIARTLQADHIPFIYLSANSSQKILEEAKTTEPDGFLVKPVRETDLMIAIEIALYRHTHSLESRLKQEELLEQKLSKLSTLYSDIQEQLIAIARLLQTSLPFDIMYVRVQAPNADRKHLSCMRTGLDEYQLMENFELAAMDLLENPDDKEYPNMLEESAFINRSVESDYPLNSFPATFFSRFLNISSQLEFLAPTANGIIHYYFFSRRVNLYTQHHINLLKRMKGVLFEIHKSWSGVSSITENLKFEAPFADSSTASIIGRDPIFLSTLDLAKQVAPYDTSVLLLGETGTGKEKVAEYIYELSSRKSQPFIKINCAAIPSSLIESELFGHERGAFTGAMERKKGKFEIADGGTIFLDEIGELPLDMQVKLLRVLQEKEIDAIGSTASKRVNVRIIAATNRNLEKEVADGHFRLDLYYRLNVFPITLPALRERRSDISLLANHFAVKFTTAFKKEFGGLSPLMESQLNSYSWPGNIRELENVIERSVIMSTGGATLTLAGQIGLLDNETTANKTIETLKDIKDLHRDTERDYIILMLKKAAGRVRGANGAASLLDIKPTTLESIMARLGITKADYISSGDSAELQ